MPFTWPKKKSFPNKDASLKVRGRTTLIAGIICGLLYTAASTFQQYGVVYTTVGKAGFITTLYIIFVPLLGIFLKKKIPRVVGIGAGMAAVGMYFLCITEGFMITQGDILVFICAILFAIHILVIDYYAPNIDGVILSCMQLFICGIICTIFAFVFEQPSFSQLNAGLVPLLYSGILSCGVGYTLQILGQKNVNPTVASLILSLESVVAALTGWLAYRSGFLIADQTLTVRQIWGCVIVFASVIFVQLPLGKKNKI